MAGRRSGFGHIRRLPSKRYQASYIGPDLARHTAPKTFEAEIDAQGWLAREHRLITDDAWTPPKDRGAKREAPTTFGDYAEAWLKRRQRGAKPLKPRTVEHYRTLLDRFLLPAFGTRAVGSVTEVDVEVWHDGLADITGPTYRAHAYSLLRTIYLDAQERTKGTVRNPCIVKGAGSTKRVKKIEPASLDDLEALMAAMPERLRAMVLVMAWCALRFGEAAELRRKDVDLTNRVLKVRRAVVRVGGELVVGDPKSYAGERDVAIPPHLLPILREHMAAHAAAGRDGLLFPAPDGGHLAHSSLMWHWNRARVAAGRPDLTPHSLRHTGAVLAAQTGATLAELMARLGHSTPSAAMRYQHAAKGRDQQIAEALSAMAARP